DIKPVSTGSRDQSAAESPEDEDRHGPAPSGTPENAESAVLDSPVSTERAEPASACTAPADSAEAVSFRPGSDDRPTSVVAADDASADDTAEVETNEPPPSGEAPVETGPGADELEQPAAVAPGRLPGSGVGPEGTGQEIEDRPVFSLTSYVLLRNPCEVSPRVFLASLRRGGQRDARLADPQDVEDDERIEAGDMTIAIRGVDTPCEAERIEAALPQDAGRSDHAESVGAHEAHVVVTLRYDASTLRTHVVRMQHRAHAALTEFLPVLGVLWPKAQRWVPVDDLAPLASMADDPDRSVVSTCVSYRSFPLDGENAGLVLSDSVGLHAFGLPDVQMISHGPLDAAATGRFHELVERFFASGCDLANDSEFSLGQGDSWRVTYARSAYAPDREVVQLAAVRRST
ncbi:MAG: hypothetical protein ACE5E1_10250, partial [Phycisphaerae bacterium]